MIFTISGIFCTPIRRVDFEIFCEQEVCNETKSKKQSSKSLLDVHYEWIQKYGFTFQMIISSVALAISIAALIINLKT